MKPKLNKLKKVLKEWFDSKEYDEIGNMLIEKSLNKSIEIKEENRKCYSFYAEVMGIIPKNEAFEIFVKKNFDVTERTINLDYTQMNFKEMSSMYNIKLLNVILKLIKNYERCILKIKNDYPLWVEVRDFIILLAPIEKGEDLI